MRTLVCFWGIFCLSFIIANAQWQPCSAPAINRINQMYNVKDAFIAITNEYLVHRSTDNGATWEQVNTTFEGKQLQVQTAIRDTLWAFDILAKQPALHFSTDIGTTWQIFDTQYRFAKIVSTNNALYAFTNFLQFGSQTITSTDGGISWTSFEIDDTILRIFDIYATDNVVIVATDKGIFYSTDEANTWQLSPLQGSGTITGFWEFNATLFVGTTLGIYRSAINTIKWEELSLDKDLKSFEVTSLIAVDDATLWVGTVYGIFASNDNGKTWNPVHELNFETEMVNFGTLAKNSKAIVASTNKILIRTSDKGTTWQPSMNGLHTITIASSFITNNGNLWARTETGFMFNSNDNGDSWTENEVLRKAISSVIMDNGVTFVASNGLFRSTNDGESWEDLFDKGLQHRNTVKMLVNSNDTLIVQTERSISRSGNLGETWELLTIDKEHSTKKHTALFAANSLLFAIIEISPTTLQAYKSADNGKNWEKIPLPSPTLYTMLGARGFLYCTTDDGIYRSSDNGSNWEKLSLPLQTKALMEYNSVLIAGTEDGVYISNNDGALWEKKGLNQSEIQHFTRKGNTLFASVIDNGLWKTDISQIITSLSERDIISSKIQIVPQPSNGNITLMDSQGMSRDIRLEIYTMQGEKIAEYTVNVSASIMLQNIPSGYYYCKLYDRSQILYSPLIIQQ